MKVDRRLLKNIYFGMSYLIMKGKSKFFIIAVLLLTIFSEPIIFAETENSIYIDLKLKRTPSVEDKIDVPDTIFLELGVITGKLYGSPLDDIYWFIDMNEKQRPAINITSYSKELHEYSSIFKKDKFNNGLSIIPRNTKFLRLSTFGYDSKNSLFLSGGLEDEEGNPVMLAYFDRPCTITGSVHFEKEGTYYHSIKIDKAGIHKLTSIGENDKFLVTAANDLDPIKVIFLQYLNQGQVAANDRF